jgi:hypothetical protein
VEIELRLVESVPLVVAVPLFLLFVLVVVGIALLIRRFIRPI